jgi:hypothetical protein
MNMDSFGVVQMAAAAGREFSRLRAAHSHPSARTAQAENIPGADLVWEGTGDV